MLESLFTLAPPTELAGTMLAAYVLLDLFLIVTLARMLGNVLVRMGQPRVVGEILAGIVLGPTLLGATLSQTLTPLPVRPVLGVLATVGLILFMFLAGVEYELRRMVGRAGKAVALALLAVAVPALVGFPVAQVMHNSSFAGPAGGDFLPFAMFIGALLSITAFPVMAHILMERGELNSSLGALAMASTGFMALFMFGYLAAAIAVGRADGITPLLLQFLTIILFGVVSRWVVRPLLRRVLVHAVEGDSIRGDAVAFIFGGLMLYGLIADRLGIHVMLGGFIWGLLLPEVPALRRALASRVRDVTMVLFLPVFFAVAGFATDFKLLTAGSLSALALLLLAATGSKFGATLPARAFGLTWSEVVRLGALFNTRGLFVLVGGLIGLQMQIITQLTFTLIVVVALVTNLMTLPLLRKFTPKELVPAPTIGVALEG